MMRYLFRLQKKIKGSFTFELRGSETNIDYLLQAKNNFSQIVPEKQYKIKLQDFIDFATPCNNDLFFINQNQEFANANIVNPPYAYTQILGAEKSQQNQNNLYPRNKT